MSEKEFVNYLEYLNIHLTKMQLNQLNRYYELLIEYNKIMNLTGITEKKQVYLKHFYDSLTLIRIIELNKYSTLCDIGTGAGFPGMVLKIVFPNLKVTLVDALNKRVSFLKKVIEELNLKNIEVIHGRAEEYARENREKFEITTCRAVAPLNILLEYMIPMTKTNFFAVFMKANIEEELQNSKHALEVLHSKIIDKQEFILPFENSRRTLLKIQKIKDNKKYPRKNSEIKKYPL